MSLFIEVFKTSFSWIFSSLSSLAGNSFWVILLAFMCVGFIVFVLELFLQLFN